MEPPGNVCTSAWTDLRRNVHLEVCHHSRTRANWKNVRSSHHQECTWIICWILDWGEGHFAPLVSMNRWRFRIGSWTIFVWHVLTDPSDWLNGLPQTTVCLQMIGISLLNTVTTHRLLVLENRLLTPFGSVFETVPFNLTMFRSYAHTLTHYHITRIGEKSGSS